MTGNRTRRPCRALRSACYRATLETIERISAEGHPNLEAVHSLAHNALAAHMEVSNGTELGAGDFPQCAALLRPGGHASSVLVNPRIALTAKHALDGLTEVDVQVVASTAVSRS